MMGVKHSANDREVEAAGFCLSRRFTGNRTDVRVSSRESPFCVSRAGRKGDEGALRGPHDERSRVSTGHEIRKMRAIMASQLSRTHLVIY